jgi:hypothetical protein
LKIVKNEKAEKENQEPPSLHYRIKHKDGSIVDAYTDYGIHYICRLVEDSKWSSPVYFVWDSLYWADTYNHWSKADGTPLEGCQCRKCNVNSSVKSIELIYEAPRLRERGA